MAKRRAKDRQTTITRPEMLTRGSDEAFRAFIYGLLVTSTRMERIRNRIGELIDVNGIQYHILSIVQEMRGKGPVSVGDVATILQAGQSHVTMETGKLVRKGLLAKRRNPEDRRGTLLELTDQGITTLDALAPDQQKINDALFANLSSTDFEAYQAITEKMIANTERALKVAEQALDDQNTKTTTGSTAA